MVPGLIDQVQSISHSLETSGDLDPLMERIGDARYVLLGEASHGTHEYYAWRSRISKRLITEKGFNFIAVEGDWPDCYSVNRYVKGYPNSGESAREVVHAFERWPTWMWANWEVVALAEWLRRHNGVLANDAKVGFYGLDVYSLWDSMQAVLNYLEEKDPALVEVAKRAYRCFEPYGEDVQAYAEATAFVPDSCENEVVEVLQRLRGEVRNYEDDHESAFDAEQNAFVAVGAERYYRAMIRGQATSWNVRDQHMVETLERLMEFHGKDAKCIVWEHNTHIGDARATDMAAEGMFNVGQLVREQHAADDVVLVGFGSYKGSVIAGSYWGAGMKTMEVPEAVEGSWEDVLHQAGGVNRQIMLSGAVDSEEFMAERGHRAIGVVYNPTFEAYGNYVPTILPLRYDVFLYFDQTRALHPLHIEPKAAHEPPETYPWAV